MTAELAKDNLFEDCICCIRIQATAITTVQDRREFQNFLHSCARKKTWPHSESLLMSACLSTLSHCFPKARGKGVLVQMQQANRMFSHFPSITFGMYESHEVARVNWDHGNQTVPIPPKFLSSVVISEHLCLLSILSSLLCGDDHKFSLFVLCVKKTPWVLSSVCRCIQHSSCLLNWLWWILLSKLPVTLLWAINRITALLAHLQPSTSTTPSTLLIASALVDDTWKCDTRVIIQTCWVILVKICIRLPFQYLACIWTQSLFKFLLNSHLLPVLLWLVKWHSILSRNNKQRKTGRPAQNRNRTLHSSMITDPSKEESTYPINDGSLFLGISTPKEKDQVLWTSVEAANDSIGQVLPALVLVWIWNILADCQAGIE